MSLRLSTGLRNFLANHGSLKQALTQGVLRIYSGSQPASADDAVAGTLLIEITTGGAAKTAEVCATGTIQLAGTSGSVTGVVVNSVQMLAAAVPFNTSLTQTAADLADAINKSLASPDYIASSSGDTVTIKAMPGTGTGPNGYDITTTCSGGDLSATDVNMSGGVAAANGLAWTSSTGGKISKSGTWQGTAVAGAPTTAGCFRFTGSVADANGSSTTLIRLDGNVGTSGADLLMNNTSITAGAVHTVDSFDLTLPAS